MRVRVYKAKTEMGNSEMNAEVRKSVGARISSCSTSGIGSKAVFKVSDLFS